MKKYLTLAAVLLFSVLLYSCDNTDIPVESGFTEPFDSATGDKPEVLWQKAFGGETTVDYAMTVSIFPNEDMVVTGITHSRATWRRGIIRRGMVLRLNGNGDLIWKRILGDSTDDSIYASAPLADGGVIVGGNTARNTDKSSADIWLVRLDKDGNTVWDKDFDCQDRYDVALYLLPMPDGNVFVMGNSADEESIVTPFAAIIDHTGMARQIELPQLTEHSAVSAIMDGDRVIATFAAFPKAGQLALRTKIIAIDTSLNVSLLDDSSGILRFYNLDGRLHVLGAEQSDSSSDQTLYSAGYADGLQNKTVVLEDFSKNSLLFATMNQSAEWLCAATIEQTIPRNLLFLTDKSGKTVWSVDSFTFSTSAIEKLGNDFVVAGAKRTGKDHNQAIWIARLKGKQYKSAMDEH